METLSAAQTEFRDRSLLLSSLHLLVPPLQLISAAMWQVVQQQHMVHYGKLEEFVSLVIETVPELLSDRQRTQLTVGLRERTTGGRMASPVEFESKTDTALQVVLWELLSRLEQLLPVPDLRQTVSWLSAAPSVLEECVQSVCKPQQLKTLLQHHRGLGHLDRNDTCPALEVVDSNKQTDRNNQSEFVPDSLSFLSSVFPSEDMKAEPVMDSKDYTAVELKSSLDRIEDSEEMREMETGYGMSREEQDILSDLKEEEERQSVMVEMENGVRDEEGLWRQQVEESDEQRKRDVTEQITHSDRGKNERKSEHEEGEELSKLVLSCLLRQPRVLIGRCDIKSISVPVASPLHSVSGKRGQRLRSPWRQKEALLMMQKNAAICHLERPLRKLPASSENGIYAEPSLGFPVISHRNQNTGQSEVFAQAKYPLVCIEGMKLQQHIEKIHPEEHSRFLRPGGNRAENPLPPSSTHQHPTPPKTLSTPTQSHTGTPGAHTCSQCGKSFKCGSMLSMHRRTHTERPHDSQCGKDLCRTPCLIVHEVKRGEYPFKCSLCGKSLMTVQGLKSHQKTHSEELLYRCSQCGKSLMSSSDLSKHHAVKHPHQCAHCDKRFIWPRSLRNHQRCHTGERPYSCSQCGKNFTRRYELTIHRRTHTGERPYQCSQCGKSFSRSSALAEHRRIHTGDRPYRCSQCGKSFTNQSALRKHNQSHTGERPYQCSHCGKHFKRANTLTEHRRIHTGDRPHHCSQCGKSFTKLSSLTEHQRTHTGDRPHKCSDCGKNFITHYKLIVHQRCHTGERPYQCSQCGKSFTTRSDFRRHNRSHTGEQPYQCSQCGKRFKRSTTLTAHWRIHTGDSPYCCSQCGKSFTKLSTLTEHQRAHTGNCHTSALTVERISSLNTN